MNLLILASLLWVGLHIGVSGTALRGVLVARIGEQGFRGLFSVASIGIFALLVYGFIHAPRTSLWVAPSRRVPASSGLMLTVVSEPRNRKAAGSISATSTQRRPSCSSVR
jgi:uncharacterized membrane protein